MPSLVSLSERALLTGIFDDIFDTFQRNIIVVKEPLKIPITPVPTQNLFGFGASQAQETFTYSGVTGIYPAVIRYGSNQSQDAPLVPELNAFTFNGPVSIKVRRETRDFINTDKTLHVIVDGRTFFLDTDEHKQAFLDSAYYIYNLRVTK